MNMVCINTDWGHYGQTRDVLEVRAVPVSFKPANGEALKDPFQKIGSFSETAPEDRQELIDLLEEAFAGI